MRQPVAGRVVIPASVPAFSAGTLHVSLEDVSYADRAAVVVAQETIDGVAHVPATGESGGPNATIVPFGLLPLRDLDPANDYSVRVRLDVVAGAGQDAFVMESDRSYPVLTRGHGSDVSVRLETWRRPGEGVR